ncbi:MAG: hypothetical protein WCK37_01935 [Candidatus Falkowbacteria bacterium]
MDKLLEQLKNVPAEEIPTDLRLRIKKQLLVIKFRFYLLVTFFALSFVFVFLSLHVYGQIAETEALTVVKALISDFDFSLDYVFNLFSGLNEVLPIIEMALWFINLGLLMYAVKIARRYRRQLFNIY